MKHKKEIKNQKQNKTLNNYAIYSAIAFQMIAIIGAGSYLGYVLDEYFNTSKPVLTAGLSLLSVLASIYVVVKQILSNEKNNNS